MILLMIITLPKDFDIADTLSMREAIGVFEERYKKCTLKDLKLLAMSVVSAPITILPDTKIHEHTMIKLFDVLNDLGVILLHRMDHRYEATATRVDWNGTGRDTPEKVNTFISINMLQMLYEKKFLQMLEAVQKLDEYKLSPEELKKFGIAS